jgi:hypothetical protein
MVVFSTKICIFLDNGKIILILTLALKKATPEVTTIENIINNGSN